jgi:hypothetical protein
MADFEGTGSGCIDTPELISLFKDLFLSIVDLGDNSYSVSPRSFITEQQQGTVRLRYLFKPMILMAISVMLGGIRFETFRKMPLVCCHATTRLDRHELRI